MLTRYLKSSRGSIIVDAACCLPIFIIALGIILMLIAEAGVEDTVVFAANKAAIDSVTAVASSYGLKSDSPDLPAKAAAYAAYAASYRSALQKEWCSSSKPSVRLDGLDFDLDAYLSDGTHIDRMIRAEISFDTNIPVIGTFLRKISAERCVLYRPWVGESTQDSEFDDTRVYIFPKRGERYHNAGCSSLKNGEIQIVLTPNVRKHYRGCTTCHADRLPDGAAVFLMSNGSEAFHRKSCPCITKAFECVALSDAVSMGYSACALCGGTPDNYNPENDLFK